MADPVEILAFWYGGDPDIERENWFRGGPDFDDACRRFQPDWEAALAGGLTAWRAAPSSLLAYIILTDQIPRNIFREDGRAFATDALARSAARHAVAHGWDRVMRKLERLFLYMPFEHSEDLADQAECRRLFVGLGDPKYVGYAQQHQELIERFGRFPHRNALLERPSTAEEMAFMEAHGRGY